MSLRHVPLFQACGPVSVCVLSVAGVCLCLHQLRSGEKAEWGGVCQARSLTVVPKQHSYCCGDTKVTPTMAFKVRGYLHLVAVHTHIQTTMCGDPQAPASYHPHTHIRVVWTVNKISRCVSKRHPLLSSLKQIERKAGDTPKQKESPCFRGFSVLTESHSCGLGHFCFPLTPYLCLYLQTRRANLVKSHGDDYGKDMQNKPR